MNGIKLIRLAAVMNILPSWAFGLYTIIIFGIKLDQPAFIPIGLLPIVGSLMLVALVWKTWRVAKPLEPKPPSASDNYCDDSVPGG